MLGFITMGSLRSTRISLKLENAFTERVKSIYAAQNACLFALTKIEITGGAGKKESVIGEDEEQIRFINPKLPWIPDPEPYSITIGDIGCDVYIEDEGGKINLNTINPANREMVVEFLLSKDVSIDDADVIIDSILDWIDKDELHHINGAETDYYERLPEPYNSKNAKLDSIEELLLVKGITSLIFDEIRDGVTVFGSGKVNLNFASRDILSSIPGLDEAMVDEIVRHIEEIGPFKNIEELRTFFFSLGIAGSDFETLKNFISLEGRNFVTIRSVCSSSLGPTKPNHEEDTSTLDFYSDTSDIEGDEEHSSFNSESDEDYSLAEHQYRIIAEINGKEKKILAVYPD